MGKGRFTAVDTRAMITELHDKLCGCRLSNCYDLNSRTYLLKFSGHNSRYHLIIESGVRFHLTTFSRSTPPMPNGLASQLRKHLRGKILNDMKQIFYDRIIIFEFGKGSTQMKLILELYSNGNILLCNAQFVIYVCLRSMKTPVLVEPSAVYNIPFSSAQHYYSNESIANALKLRVKKLIEQQKEQKPEQMMSKRQARKAKRGKISVKMSDFIMKYLLTSPTIAQSLMSECKLDGNESITDYAIISSEIDSDSDSNVEQLIIELKSLDIIFKCIQAYPRLMEQFSIKNNHGFIIAKKCSFTPLKKISIKVKPERRKQIQPSIDISDIAINDNANIPTVVPSSDIIPAPSSINYEYEQFIPFSIHQTLSEEYKIESFVSFNECVDTFYTSMESLKIELKEQTSIDFAMKKYETQLDQHSNRISDLQSSANQNSLYASIIEQNLDIVDKAIDGVSNLLKQGISWQALANRIREESMDGNPIAKLILNLSLHENNITLHLPNIDTDEYYKITVDLQMSAWNNAKKYYQMKKTIISKMVKTIEATSKATKAAKNRSKIALKHVQNNKKEIKKLRKKYWFEKFHWFISSDKYLIIAGRDAQQNELILRKYTDKKRDIYVHALIHGASSVIIKNYGENVPPESTLSEAGSFCVCRSIAWKNQISTQSYWVYAWQVSKTPPTKQFLPTGSFVIRGKRNFMAQEQLEMACVLLFKIDSESYEHNHKMMNDLNVNHNIIVDENINKKTDVSIIRTLVHFSSKVKNKYESKLADIPSIEEPEVKVKHKRRRKRRMHSKYKYNQFDEDDHRLRRKLMGVKDIEVSDDIEKKEIKIEPKSGYPLIENKPEMEELEINKNANEEKQVQSSAQTYTTLMNDLKCFVGNPNENDSIIAAIVMCAPWNSISKNDSFCDMFKVKIMPGNSKRSKVANNILKLWMSNINGCADIAMKTKYEMVAKCIPETEINSVFLSEVRIEANGLKELYVQESIQKKKEKKMNWKASLNKSKKQQKKKVKKKGKRSK